MKTLTCRIGRLGLAGLIASASALLPYAPYSPMGTAPASAQAGILTVGAASAALSAALDQFKAAIAQAGDELRGLGNSLQANAQNVLQDMNKIMKDRMDQAVSSLDVQERRIVEDAEALTRQVQKATEALLKRAGDEARQTIVEADISAYDALFSLPCRDLRPRIVAAFPGEIVASQGQPVMTLRGNYLTQGSTLTASVDGKAARIVERLDHSIKVELPDTIASPTLNRVRAASVQVAGLAALDRTLWFGLVCREKSVSQAPVAAAITIRPQIKWSVSGKIRSTHLIESSRAEPVRKFSRTGNDHCDDTFDVTTSYCAADENAVRTTGTLSITSANCGSSAGAPQPSGPRCVSVPGHVQGCGADRGPFHTWLGCKGRGWLNYDLTLMVTTKSRVEAGSANIEVAPSVTDRSWSFSFPPAGDQAQYEYEATIQKTQGDEVLNRWTVSGANPNAGPVKSRVADGALAVELEE
ncbi:hypothetical protein [Bradyrhizobium archetypum]|uniref:OmpH family outer membrane protein n=1 Tax=Bradyrhizobium archetypum TaxID=2721160 RepID=A0A7Y4H282_9BRAD|nr:hypothetical protein [Bradyrhizobium archetypum]NOJ46073.1 OmpH family outer membrane protein [Bradyrhizobium archetypum]